MPATRKDGGCEFVARLPYRSGAASRASRAPEPSPSAPPSPMSATPAMQNDGRCEVVPRKTTVDVRLCPPCHVEIKVDASLCHACNAEVARRHGHARLNQAQALPSAMCMKSRWM